MAEGLASRDEIRVYDPGDMDREAEIVLPRPILDLMGIVDGYPIDVQVRDDEPIQIRILRPDTPEDLTDPNIVMAIPKPDPDPGHPPRYTIRFPREWKEEHWRRTWEEMNDFGDDSYHLIDVAYTIEEARTFLQEDGTLVIPL